VRRRSRDGRVFVAVLYVVVVSRTRRRIPLSRAVSIEKREGGIRSVFSNRTMKRALWRLCYCDTKAVVQVACAALKTTPFLLSTGRRDVLFFDLGFARERCNKRETRDERKVTTTTRSLCQRFSPFGFNVSNGLKREEEDTHCTDDDDDATLTTTI